jgi:hypothetical protein
VESRLTSCSRRCDDVTPIMIATIARSTATGVRFAALVDLIDMRGHGGQLGKSATLWVTCMCLHLQSKLQQELATTQEVALRVGVQNKQLMEQCSALRAQYRSQEDDREYLIRQNLVVKKENEAHARQVEVMCGQLEALVAERNAAAAAARDAVRVPPLREICASCSRLHAWNNRDVWPLEVLAVQLLTRHSVQSDSADAQVGADGAARGHLFSADQASRLEQLQRLLESERARTRAARSAHAAALAKQGEVHAFVLQLVERVKEKRRALAQHVGGSELAAGSMGGLATVHEAPGVGSRQFQKPQTSACRARPFSAHATVQAGHGTQRVASGRRPRPQSALELATIAKPTALVHLSPAASTTSMSSGLQTNSLGHLAAGRKRPHSGKGCFGKVAPTAGDKAGLPSDLSGEQVDALLQVREAISQG